MLRVESQGPVLRITLDRPEVRNAFNDDLIAALTQAFRNLPEGTRVVVLAGEGKAFCAGGDLDWMRRAAAYSEEENIRDAILLAELFHAIAHCPAYTIARVHGAAFGGGCGLVASCDCALAAPEAIFAFSEVRLGLIPGTISTVVIPRIGAGHARKLFATGEAFGADLAHRIGLVHEVGDLDTLLEAQLKQILCVGPEAVTAAKELVHDFPLSKEEAAARLARARAGAEGVEGVSAFLDRRKASFVVDPS